MMSDRLGLQNKNRHGELMTIVAYRGAVDIDIQLESGVFIPNRTFRNFKRGTIASPIEGRLGEVSFSNKGEIIKIINYVNASDIDVQFEDGIIYKNRTYGEFINKRIKKPENRVGEKSKNCEDYTMTIITYRGATDLDVSLNDDTIINNISYSSFKKGSVKNPNHKSVCGIGYFGQGDYKAKVDNKFTKEYSKWNGMMRRCYDEKELLKHPTYKSVVVCDEWQCFQNFAKWFEENYTEGFELDKDILLKGNKLYSPETCCFVPREVNTLLIKSDSMRGDYPIGVTKTVNNRYKARLSKNGLRVVLGTFKTTEEAFQAYKIAKEEYIKELANKWKSQITEQTYNALINYQVEIAD